MRVLFDDGLFIQFLLTWPIPVRRHGALLDFPKDASYERVFGGAGEVIDPNIRGAPLLVLPLGGLFKRF